MVAYVYDTGGDIVEIYIYECAVCKKEIRTMIIKTCLICNKKICRDCYRDGFCTHHYNMLSNNGKEEFNQIIDLNKKKKLNISLIGVLSLIIWLVLFIIVLSSIIIHYEFINMIWLPIIIIILFSPVVILVIFWSRKIKNLNILLINGKISIFERQKKDGALAKEDALISKMQKYCLYCERELKIDAIYCDKCGRIHS